MKCLAAIVCTLFTLAFTAPAASSQPLIQPEQRIVFIGDSITYAGGYVEQMDAYLATKYPGKQFELINMGVPSETACGLSEPYHPFPRPDVNERLGRLLAKMEPDVVIACYGMNDGIYHPFDQQRFATYKEGISKIVVACKAAGAKLILVTPPPFDSKANPKNVVDRESSEFGFRGIYRKYDEEVLAVYAKWIIEQAGRPGVAAVVDIHTPVKAYLAAEREKDATFKMSGDGVHVNSEGHRAIASALLRGLGFEDFESTELDSELLELVKARHRLLRDAWLSEVGHKRPGMKKGKPIDKAQREAAVLNQRIAENR